MSGQWSLDACWAPQKENTSPEVHSQFFPDCPVWDLLLCQVCFIFLLDDTFLLPQNSVCFFLPPSPRLSLSLSLTKGTEDQACNSPGWWFSNVFKNVSQSFWGKSVVGVSMAEVVFLKM